MDQKTLELVTSIFFVLMGVTLILIILTLVAGIPIPTILFIVLGLIIGVISIIVGISMFMDSRSHAYSGGGY